MSTEDIPNADLYLIFKASSIGTALQDTLDTLQVEGKIDPREADEIQFAFERAMAKRFQEFSNAKDKIELFLDVRRKLLAAC